MRYTIGDLSSTLIDTSSDGYWHVREREDIGLFQKKPLVSRLTHIISIGERTLTMETSRIPKALLRM